MVKKLLLHICCGLCAIFPIKSLSEKGIEVFGFYYNPNIHPYQEWQRRLEALKKLTEERGYQVRLIVREDYPLEEFLRNVVFREQNRCLYCYYTRLEATAKTAKKSGFDGFSSTLLYSKFQKHELIKNLGEDISKQIGITFYYEDFRTGWSIGQEESRRLGLYRQQYCGCIYSEKERFYKKKDLQ